MKLTTRISLALIVFFLFFFSVTLVHAEMGGNCAEFIKDLKSPLKKAMDVHVGMDKTFKSDQLIDKYNRHVNILVSNLGRLASRMERLLGKAEKDQCSQVVKKIKGGITSTKNIYENMMTSLQLPAPKEALTLENNKLKSELDNLMRVQ